VDEDRHGAWLPGGRRPELALKEDEHGSPIRIASEGENAKKDIRCLSFAGNNIASRAPR
jgi:hypothetical protein